MTQDWHRIVALEEVPQGRMHGVEIGGRDLMICHSRDGWFALDNVCTHAYARMHEGRLRGCRIICPLHGASFDIRDGIVRMVSTVTGCRMVLLHGFIKKSLRAPREIETARSRLRQLQRGKRCGK